MSDPSICPRPFENTDHVLLAHGEGARLTRQLIHDIILPHFDNEWLSPLGDAAILPSMTGQPVITTDSYVVSPLFFPGGDIGQLSVFGTINDLVVSGAEPLAISVALILEEGLPWNTLTRVLQSLAKAAKSCRVPVVTGDTKVVPRGAADGLFITTTGYGRKRDGIELGANRVRPGDCIIVSGTIGDHGLAVLSARNGFQLEGELQSDAASLQELMGALFEAGIDVHFARDPTRGGVSAVLQELAQAANITALLEEQLIPVSAAVRGACEILGLDPLHIANEGKVIVVVDPEQESRTLECLHSFAIGRQACRIGEIKTQGRSSVLIRGLLGVVRILVEPTGAMLPRIC